MYLHTIVKAFQVFSNIVHVMFHLTFINEGISHIEDKTETRGKWKMWLDVKNERGAEV